MITEKQARRAGAKLLAKMKGRGWKLRVHENFGWHYSVVLKCVDPDTGKICYLTVYEDAVGKRRQYTTLYDGGRANGRAAWSHPGDYAGDPNAAVELQFRWVSAYAADINAARRAFMKAAFHETEGV